MLTAEQIVAAQKSNLDTLFGLTAKAFEGVEKLVELNLQVAKAAMGEALNRPRPPVRQGRSGTAGACRPRCCNLLPRRPPLTAVTCNDIATATTSEMTKAC